VDVVAQGGGVVEREAFSADWFETQAARVERVGFRAGRLGMGYNEDEVDAFLDRIVATLRGTTDRPVTPGDVRAATFSTVLFKPGYAIGEVDEFLAELADVIAHLRPAG
jgi:DivIVA domain-containing protein